MLGVWAVAILALLCFVVELILHVASFVSRDPRDWVQPDWVLPAASLATLIIVLLLAIVVDARGKGRGRQRESVTGREHDPPWFKPILWAFVGYAAFSGFMAMSVDLRHGVPTRQAQGTYVAESGHGRPAVPISADEFHRLRRLEVRRGTAVFMLLYVGIASDLLFALSGAERSQTMGTRRSVFVIAFTRRRNL